MAELARTDEIEMEVKKTDEMAELEVEENQWGEPIEDLEGEEDRNKAVMKLLDSMDGYLTQFNSLSSTLRQGWLDLASARHSMGTSRINYTLLDLKEHPASTSLRVISDDDDDDVDDSTRKQKPRFQLRKWGSLDNQTFSAEKLRSKEEHEESSGSLKQRHRGDSQLPECASKPDDGAQVQIDDKVKNERSKSLAVFGTLVSPKLRASQLSFEKAIEAIVEIANLRSEILAASDQVQRILEGAKKVT
ncbi:unnamed protein product [Linum tenue]|uniref:Vacuolar ATPase assembly protein VMA22 n=1 Tax=Linum tenue TaxID=586396 RepID=A0AAV0LKJ4_9ROSI|nr:unnamed protein product [Linum tenue]